MGEISETIIDQYQDVYPELSRNRDFILSELEKEEQTFNKTLDKGLKAAEKIFEIIKDEPTLSGGLAFKLYDTFGFPIELTQELAAEKGKNVIPMFVVQYLPDLLIHFIFSFLPKTLLLYLIVIEQESLICQLCLIFGNYVRFSFSLSVQTPSYPVCHHPCNGRTAPVSHRRYLLSQTLCSTHHRRSLYLSPRRYG